MPEQTRQRAPRNERHEVYSADYHRRQEFFAIVEVNQSGEILVPAELAQAPPHTRLEAGRESDSVVLKPLAEVPSVKTAGVSSLLILEGRLANPAMTFHREDIYEADGRWHGFR